MTATCRKCVACRISMIICQPRRPTNTMFVKLYRRQAMNSFNKFGVLLSLFLLSPLAFSHHSSSGIDPNGSVTVTGTVKEFKWGNPHSWIELEVVNDEGVTEIWN